MLMPLPAQTHELFTPLQVVLITAGIAAATVISVITWVMLWDPTKVRIEPRPPAKPPAYQPRHSGN